MPASSDCITHVIEYYGALYRRNCECHPPTYEQVCSVLIKHKRAMNYAYNKAPRKFERLRTGWLVNLNERVAVA